MRTRDQRTSRLSRAVLVLNGFDHAISPSAARYAFDRGLAPLADSAEVIRIAWRRRYPHDFIDPLGAIGDREAEGRRLLLDVLGVQPPPQAPPDEIANIS